ncbi:UNVERIFIED_CONTAM: hypothetical protein FKN15_032195 [Acipenser sinensis]
MRPIAWTSPVRVQAIPLPTMDGCSPPGGKGFRTARVSLALRTPATPVVWPGACGLTCKLPRAVLSSDAVVLRWLHGGSMNWIHCDVQKKILFLLVNFHTIPEKRILQVCYRRA